MRLLRPLPILVWIILGLCIVLICIGATTSFRRSLEPFADGIHSLRTGQSIALTNPPQAVAEFDKADRSLSQAIAQINQGSIASKVGYLIPPFSWQQSLFETTAHLSKAGKIASNILTDAPTISSNDPKVILHDLTANGGIWLDTHTPDLDALEEEITEADRKLAQVPSLFDPLIPELAQLRTTINDAKTLLPKTRMFAQQLRSSFGFGGSDTTTTIVLFQNSSEIRTMGGFPGSYATITAKDGVIEDFWIDTNIYKLDRQFELRNLEKPGAALQTIASRLGFRDATVDCGFRDDCSVRVARMYQGMSGSQPISVVYVSSDLLKRLLQYTGPISITTSTGVQEVNADTVTDTLTQEVERDYFTASENVSRNEPKAIIANLFPELISALRSRGKLLLVPEIISQALTQNELQLWSNSKELDEIFDSIQTSNEARPSDPNWYHLVGNNLGGLKSSANIHEVATISDRIITGTTRTKRTLILTRSHQGTGVWPDGVNRHHITLYLPHSARVTLLPIGSGGDYLVSEEALREAGLSYQDQSPSLSTSEFGTVVSFWATVSPGETKTFTIEWEIE